MLVRSILCSLSARRFLYSSSFTNNPIVRSNLKDSLGAKLFRIEDPSKSADVIMKWKNMGLSVSLDDIRSAVLGLINHMRHPRALMIWDSLVEQNVVELESQDYASHLRLIAHVRGLDSAEKYFEGVPEGIKDECIYDNLLNIYKKRRAMLKAEALMEKMAEKGLLSAAPPYIHMMCLYISIGKIDKAEEMIKAVKKHIEPSLDMYNLWLNACKDVWVAEMVYSEMKGAKVEPNCLTHGLLAGLYIKNKLFGKAASALKEMEELLSTGNRTTHWSAIAMHGSIAGSKDAVLRIWDLMKLKFKLSDYEYGLAVSALLKVDSCEKAEEVYCEWKERGGPVTKYHRASLELLEKAKEEKSSFHVMEDVKAQKEEESLLEFLLN